MPSILTCRPLRPDELFKAYPIVSAIEGAIVPVDRWCLSTEEWLTGRAAVTEHRGIMGVCSEFGYIYGLFFHRVVHDVRHGRVLDVSQLRVLEIGRAGRTLQASLQATERLAREHGCHGVLVEMLDHGAPARRIEITLPEPLEAMGFQAHCVRLFRALDDDGKILRLPRASHRPHFAP